MNQQELEWFTSNPPLQIDGLHCYNDPETQLTLITYQGELTPAITSQAYAWIGKGHIELLRLVYGCIFDFRKVTVFNTGNLSTFQRKTREYNQGIQDNPIPVAMIVANLYQEKMVQISSKISPGEHRKRIVKSFEEAKTFFDEYNQTHRRFLTVN